jgi:hypothetical protein
MMPTCTRNSAMFRYSVARKILPSRASPKPSGGDLERLTRGQQASVLRDGQTVAVDGTAGTVRIEP